MCVLIGQVLGLSMKFWRAFYVFLTFTWDKTTFQETAGHITCNSGSLQYFHFWQRRSDYGQLKHNCFRKFDRGFVMVTVHVTLRCSNTMQWITNKLQCAGLPEARTFPSNKGPARWTTEANRLSGLGQCSCLWRSPTTAGNDIIPTYSYNGSHGLTVARLAIVKINKIK